MIVLATAGVVGADGGCKKGLNSIQTENIHLVHTMKKSMGLLLTAFLLSNLPSCNNDNFVELNSKSDHINPDSLFTDLDPTLHIQTAQEGNLTIYKIDKYNTVVVKIPHISSYLYLRSPAKSLKQIAQDSNYTLVVNASYFDVVIHYGANDTTITFKHAGFLKINDTIYEEMKDDRQLSRLFAYDSKNNIVDYFGVNDLDQTKDYDLVVQIGPQIIWKNEIDTACIEASFNGAIPWARTTFASVNGKELYVIVNLGFAPVTLLDLGRMLRSSGIFRKELNIINFDGGFSTSLYIKNHPEFSANPDNTMPVLIGVR